MLRSELCSTEEEPGILMSAVLVDERMCGGVGKNRVLRVRQGAEKWGS
jgi:hypothetical protein